MPTRSEVVADAAVTVVARDGLRGLTHRAVDIEAGLPHGSTSNCFRSRSALLLAIVDRLEQLDRVALGPTPPDATSLPRMARSLATSVATMTSASHVRATRARLALLLDETAGPAMAAGHQRFLELLEALLAQAGHADPVPTARVVSDLLEGALLHAASVPARTVDVDELARAVELLLH